MLTSKLVLYLFLFLFVCFNEREILLRLQGHGAWAGGHLESQGEVDGGALFDLLLGAQVVGLAAFVAADSAGV